jgi:lauroyl/myristoyl acyltransferase
VGDVVLWRPWALRRADVRELDHLVSARASGRGVVIVTAHTQLVSQVWVALAGGGHQPYVATDGFRRKPTGYAGMVKAIRKRNGQEAGARYLSRGRTYPVFRALLRRGEICVLAFDVRGGRETQFGGARVRLARGSADLAFETGALVVPVVGLRRGTGLACSARQPPDPGRYDDAEQLHQEIASILAQTLRPHLAQTFPRGVLRIAGAVPLDGGERSIRRYRLRPRGA